MTATAGGRTGSTPVFALLGAAALALSLATSGCDPNSQTTPPPPPSARDGAVIIVVRNQTQSNRLGNFVANLYRDIRKTFRQDDVGLETNVISLQDFAVGLIVNSRPLTPDEMSHDADKLFGDLAEGREPHEWNRFKLGGQLLFPLEFPIPGIAGPIGISIGADVNLKRTYTLTVKTAELIEDRKTILGDAWDRLAGTVESIGAVRIPFSPEQLVRKYAVGTEIVREGVHGVLTHVGLSAGAGVVAGGTDIFALVTANLESRLKILYDQDRRLVRYSVKTLKETGDGHDLGVTLGITLFQTQLLSGVLNVNLLASRTMKSADSSLVFDYTYDISQPGAAEALSAALRGDLRPTQALAIFREDEDHYRGVIINAQKAIDMLTTARAHALGFSINNSALNTTLGGIQLGEAFGGFLLNSTTSASHTTDETQTDFQHETAKVRSLDYDAEHRGVALWGLLANNRKKLHTAAQIVEAQVTDPDGGRREVAEPKVSFDYRYENHRQGGGVARDFFNSAVNVVGWSDPTMTATIQKVFAAGKCESGSEAVFQMRGTLYEKALKRIAALDENAVWETYGALLGLSDPSALDDSPDRAAFIESLDADRRGAIARIRRDFLPFWHDLRAATDDRARMAVVHDLLARYGLDTSGFEFLLALAGNEGTFGSVSLKSKRCNFTWSRKGDLDFNLADVSLDWNRR